MGSVENDQFAKFCGVEVLSAQDGNATARLKVQQHHLNGLGIAHGGAIFTLADTTFAAASNSHGYDAVAINTSMSFMKATNPGQYLIAKASEVNERGRVGCYKIDIENETGEVVACFQGLAYRKF